MQVYTKIVKGGTIHNIRLDEATRHDRDVQVRRIRWRWWYICIHYG